MRKITAFLLLAFLAFSCKDDEGGTTATATVNLNFRALYNDQPLVLYQSLDYPDGSKIRFQNFNFFISKITLLGEGTTPDHELSEAEFVDFQDNTDLAAAQLPQAYEFQEVPSGTYRGIKIGFGVPASQNNEDAGKLSEDNPLREHFSSHFWSDWGSFIFMKSEGIYDLNGDGLFNQSDRGFEHHPGTDEVYTTVEKLKTITLEKGQVFDLDLTADIYDIYVENGAALDLQDPLNKDTQDASDLPLAIKLMNHWNEALKL